MTGLRPPVAGDCFQPRPKERPQSAMCDNPHWKYEKGEGRRKHTWDYPWAGFEPSVKGPIGKCPNTLGIKIAEELLNTGLPWFRDNEDKYPKKIYNVHQGVIYVAVPTRPGLSYHGYPWRGDSDQRENIPIRILEELKTRAKEKNCESELNDWLEKYGKK